MESLTYLPYRRKRLGGFAYALHSILTKAKKGVLPEDSLQYFLVYAKRFYEKAGYEKKVETMEKLLDEWNTISMVQQSLSLGYDTSKLSEIEQILASLFEYIIFDSATDIKLKTYALTKTKLYYEYVSNLLEIKKEELFYKSLSEIWISIYADTLLTQTEIIGLINEMKNVEQETISRVEYEIDESVDTKKISIVNKPKSVSLLRVLRLMQGFLQELRLSFIKATDINSKINISKIYSFTLLMVAQKILKNRETEEFLVTAFDIVKKLMQYKLAKIINRYYKSKEIEQLVVTYENRIDSLVQELFELSENIISKIEVSDMFKRKKVGEEEEKSFIDYQLERDITKWEKKHLVGLSLKREDIESYITSIRTGEKISTIQMWVTPFILTEKKMPAITLVLGATGSGKTIFGSNLIRVLTKSKYAVVDLSLNLERPAEMVFCSMPMFESLYKKEFKKLTKVQQMVPEKLNMYILIPYFNIKRLPKELPANARIITVPLKSLANKRYALSLILSKMPTKEEDSDIIDFLDFILTEIADDTWDLDTLKFYLKRLLKEKEKTIKITIKERIGNFEYPRTEEFDKRKIRKLLKMLVPFNTIISSGTASTAVKFDEILKPGVFVTSYLGHILDRTVCFAYITWLAYALMDYKRDHPEKKIGIYINEAQNIVPSQQLVGGLFSHQKYSLAVDIANLCLNWRGMGFKSIILTQNPSQIRDQFVSQSQLKVLFYMEKKEDINTVLGDIVNQEFRENLKFIIKNKRFYEEHLAIVKFGPEIDKIHIISSAITPFCVERENVDPFKLYAKMYPSETVKLEKFVQLIERDKKETLRNLVKSNLADDDLRKAVELLDSGETITTINPEKEVKVSVEDLEKMTSIPEGKVVLDKEKYEQLASSRVVDENQIVISKDRLLELSAKYNVDFKELFSLSKIPRGGKYHIVKDYMHYLFFALKEFKFVMFNPRGRKKLGEGVVALEQLFKDLGLKMSHLTIYRYIIKMSNEDTLFKKLIVVSLHRQRTLYQLDVEMRNKIEKDLPEILEKTKYFTSKFKEKASYLPWRF